MVFGLQLQRYIRCLMSRSPTTRYPCHRNKAAGKCCNTSTLNAAMHVRGVRVSSTLRTGRYTVPQPKATAVEERAKKVVWRVGADRSPRELCRMTDRDMVSRMTFVLFVCPRNLSCAHNVVRYARKKTTRVQHQHIISCYSRVYRCKRRQCWPKQLWYPGPVLLYRKAVSSLTSDPLDIRTKLSYIGWPMQLNRLVHRANLAFTSRKSAQSPIS